jgi:hypothetical protein
MDTYMSSPVNLMALSEAIAWYHSNGCAQSRLAIGLLADEASNATEAAAVLATVLASGSVEVDVWANLWSQPALLAQWHSALAAFLDAPSNGAGRFPWACLGVSLGVAAFAMATGLISWWLDRERRRKLLVLGTSEPSARLLAASSGSTLRRRLSSMAVLELDAPDLAPSLMAIGSGTGSAIAFGAPHLCGGPAGYGSLASEPALAAAASMISKASRMLGAEGGTRESSVVRESGLSRATDEDALEPPTIAPGQQAASSADADAEDAEAEAAAAMAYATNAWTLPVLYFAIGVVNNIQGVAWREYLLHGAEYGYGLNPADQGPTHPAVLELCVRLLRRCCRAHQITVCAKRPVFSRAQPS